MSLRLELDDGPTNSRPPAPPDRELTLRLNTR